MSQQENIQEDEESQIARVPLEILPEGGLGTRFATSMRNFADERPRDTLLDAVEGGGTKASMRDLHDTAVNHLNLDFSAEYERPDRKEAQKYREFHHPARLDGSPLPYSLNTGQYGTCISKRVTHLRPFGSGISNYFKWLKYLGVIFGVLTILNAPAFFINFLSGTYFTSGQFEFPASIAGTTLGNLDYKNGTLVWTILGSTQRNGTDLEALLSNTTSLQSTLRLPWLCSDENVEDCLVPRDTVLVGYSIADTFGMLLFWLSILVVDKFIRKEEKDYRKKVLKVEDYSIEVRQLPRDITATKLEDFFGRSWGAVYDVQIVEATGSAIELCVLRGRLMKKLARQDALVRRLNLKAKVVRAKGGKAYDELVSSPTEKLNDEESGNIDGAVEEDGPVEPQDKYTKRINAAKVKFDKIYDKINQLDEKAANRRRSGIPLLAFVTFEQVSAKEACLADYNKRYWCRPSPKLLFEGNLLRVKSAPPPSTLLWENTDYTRLQRRVRWCVASFALVLLLLCTVGLNYIADGFRTSFAELARSGAQLINEETPCEGRYAAYLSNATEAIEFAVENQEEPWGINCLCQNELVFQKQLFPDDFDLFYAADEGVGGVCADFVLDNTTVLSISVAISAGVLVMNALINIILLFSARFMKFPSIVQRESTIMKLTFVLTFVNTAIILLAVNTDFQELWGTEIAYSEYTNIGDFTDFTSGWYERVGLEILFVMSLNIFAPHVLPTLRAIQSRMERKFKKHLSQAEMNDAYLGPEFLLSFRYAQLLLLVFFVLMYAAGMPVLYLFACLSILVTYFMDKLFFLRVCRTPPQYTVDLGKWANRMMEWAILFHLGFAIWMYSSPALFPDDREDNRHSILSFVSEETGLPVEDILTSNSANLTSSSLIDFASPYINALNRRLVRDQAIPLFLLFILIVAFKILRLFDPIRALAAKATSAFSGCLSRTCGSDPLNRFDHALGFDEEDHTPRYQQALKRGKVAGIESYNILANPDYAHAFQLASQGADGTGKVYQSLEEALRLQQKKKSSSGEDDEGDSGSESGSKATWFKRIRKVKKNKSDKESASAVSTSKTSLGGSASLGLSRGDGSVASSTSGAPSKTKKSGWFGKNRDPKASSFATAADLVGEKETEE